MVEATNAAAVAETSDTTGNAPHNGKREYNRTPVEELFDLTKPIPSVSKPDKDAHEKAIAEFEAAIDKLKADKEKVQEKIEIFLDSRKSTEIGKERSGLQELRRQKKALIDDKKAIRQRFDKIKSTTDKLSRDQKQAKQSVKFTSLKEIEDEIRRLERKQQTTSMSLGEEKKLIKEIGMLNASKSVVSQIGAKENNIQDAWDQRKLIKAELEAKDKEIDALQEQITEKSAALDAISAKENDNKDNKQKLFDERDAVKELIEQKYQERNDLRQSFREANNKWYDYKRALAAQRKIRYEEEKKEREAKEAEWLKQKEEEELKKIPYEEEMSLCDYLADFLTKTYLEDSKDKDNVGKKTDVVPVKDDPFAGLTPMKKNNDEVFLKMGKDKKPRNRVSKKNKAAPFKLNLDTFDQFGLLSLTPPTSVEMVEGSVAELKAKKKWYSEQPRGSVLTATDIRKANAAAANKASKSSKGAPGASNSSKGKGKGAFSFTEDDFAPLAGGSGRVSVNNTWGQKVPDEPTSIAVSEMAEEFPAVAKQEVSS